MQCFLLLAMNGMKLNGGAVLCCGAAQATWRREAGTGGPWLGAEAGRGVPTSLCLLPLPCPTISLLFCLTCLLWLSPLCFSVHVSVWVSLSPSLFYCFRKDPETTNTAAPELEREKQNGNKKVNLYVNKSCPLICTNGTLNGLFVALNNNQE